MLTGFAYIVGQGMVGAALILLQMHLTERLFSRHLDRIAPQSDFKASLSVIRGGRGK